MKRYKEILVSMASLLLLGGCYDLVTKLCFQTIPF